MKRDHTYLTLRSRPGVLYRECPYCSAEARLVPNGASYHASACEHYVGPQVNEPHDPLALFVNPPWAAISGRGRQYV